MTPLSKFHRIPIYDMRLWVGVADKTEHLFKKFEWAFGPQEGGQIACVSFHGSKVVMFFERKEISHEVIAHELFHATCRILEHCSHRVSPDAHEPHAYLCGYIAQLVYGDFARWKIPVRLHTIKTPERWMQPKE